MLYVKSIVGGTYVLLEDTVDDCVRAHHASAQSLEIGSRAIIVDVGASRRTQHPSITRRSNGDVQ